MVKDTTIQKILNRIKKLEKKVDTISYTSCASCPYSGSIIDGYRDCPDAYTEQSKHCNIRKEMKNE